MLMPAAKPLVELENASEFVARHIGIAEADEPRMLAAIGAVSRRALIDAIVPVSIARAEAMRLPPAIGEAAALAELRAIASRNAVLTSCIGQGYHGTVTPGVILRNVLENPSWYTAYTPYQAEISQGRLEALVNFQTMVCDLTGMAIAGSSMLDEATAAAEAMTLALRAAGNPGAAGRPVFFVADDVLPQTLDVVRTRAAPLGIEVAVGPVASAAASGAFASLLQYPGVDGAVHDLAPVVEAIHAARGVAIVAADLLALALLVPPGEFGADICVGTTQRFGMPMGNGGPHAAYLATKDAFKRQLPGRLVGVSVDAHGRPAYRLALQTREQHIRREKATSNICTAQVLPAVVSAMYAVYHGREGLVRIARRVASYAAVLASGLDTMGVGRVHASLFDTVLVDTGDGQQGRADSVVAAARARGINLRRAGPTRIGIAFDETTTRAHVESVWASFADAGLGAVPDAGWAAFEKGLAPLVPDALLRTSTFLAHPTFERYRSETEMLRYLRRLADKDLALDRSMIPLGSCTMKLNATSEMIPITWPEFAHVHPFAPADQRAGYEALRTQLEAWLCAATGYAGVSLQPNAGSQGEYAGLLAIRAWHASRGESHRTVCLIPGVGARHQPGERADGRHVGRGRGVRRGRQRRPRRPRGEVRRARRPPRRRDDHLPLDLRRVRRAGPRALRHGAPPRRPRVRRRRQHERARRRRGAGRVRWRREPPQPPQDVLHPARRRRPGRRAGLRRRRPRAVPAVGPPGGREQRAVGAVSAAPLGNAAVLPISWMYMRMMGAEGLTRATETAILLGQLRRRRASPATTTSTYSGNVEGIAGGGVAHECILDLRPLKDGERRQRPKTSPSDSSTTVSTRRR